jgi:hypothetical protein
MSALKLRRPEAKVSQEEEWQLLCACKKEIPEMPELPFKISGVWAVNKPP